MVHGLLAAKPCEIASLAGVCCSGVAAWKYAYGSVLAGISRSAVVTGSELISPSLRASQFPQPLYEEMNVLRVRRAAGPLVHQPTVQRQHGSGFD